MCAKRNQKVEAAYHFFNDFIKQTRVPSPLTLPRAITTLELHKLLSHRVFWLALHNNLGTLAQPREDSLEQECPLNCGLHSILEKDRRKAGMVRSDRLACKMKPSAKSELDADLSFDSDSVDALGQTVTFINQLKESKQEESHKLGYHTVSVIIPALNEEKSVGYIISEASTVLNDLGIPYEVIVVNDGSTDKTGLVAASCKARVLTNERNRGKGYSLRRALTHATGEIIVTIDSDGEHNPKEIPALLSQVLSGADVVAGSRFLRRQSYVTSKLNELGNTMFNFAIMMLTGNRITDSQTGFRAARKTVLDELNLTSDGYEIEAEITIKCLMSGFLLKELPISVQRRKYSKSKLRTLFDGAKILSTILKFSVSSNRIP